jgi:predicted naringenin-chalcone synthase
VANALFADGAAAVIVGCEPLGEEKSLFEIERQSSYALGETSELMTWEVSMTGMVMNLSNKIPQLLREHVASFSKDLLQSIPFSLCDWAIHPGGKAILQAVEQACLLNESQTQASWQVLELFGNMSSATFLFVLDKIKSQKNHQEWIIGLGFGPGLSMEGILLKASS